MKRFLIIFGISAFILACFFWEAGLFFSDYGLVPDILTFLFFSFILSALVVAFSKFFKFIKKTIRRGISDEVSMEESGKTSKGIIISFVIFLVVFVPETALYLISGALGFVPLTITSPFLLSMVFSLPFLVLNFIFFIFAKGDTKRGLKYGFLFFIIFFVILFGINLYIFINFRETYYSSQDIKILNEAVQIGEQIPCEKLKSNDEVARCLQEVAVEKKDTSLCDKIVGSSHLVNYYRDTCYSEIKASEAVQKADINLCSGITYELDKVGCIQKVAAKLQRPEYCESLIGTNYIDQCYFGAVEKMTDKTTIAKYCSLMTKGFVHQQLCFKLIK
jgi:hypothetical protein